MSDRPKCESDYRSPPDPVTIDRNLMWMKHFAKGIAEGVPNEIWLMTFKALKELIPGWMKMNILGIDNLNEAYWKGRELGEKMFKGGEK